MGKKKRLEEKKSIIHGSHNLTGSVEWYTPIKYIDSVRKVMGSIDCDPASNDHAQSKIKAGVYYTKENSGLVKNLRWVGSVWLNPPYESRGVPLFVEKLLYELGRHCTQAILLTHNYTDTKWFHSAAVKSSVVCFTVGRIRFTNRLTGKGNSPTHGHVFFYFGDNTEEFAKEFRKYGWVVGGFF